MREDQGEPALISPLTEEISLRRASELINSLISSSYSILSFPTKWQLIRDKLEQLNSSLVAAADGNSSTNNSALAAFLKPMITTLNDVQMLADRCSDEAYSGGKLLMRSNLDAVSSRLELIIKHLTQIYASAILSRSQAIVLTRPAVGANREDMRFYVKDLFSRLRIGDLDMRSQALTILKEILHEDQKYVRIVVLETTDSIGLLVNFLEFGDMGIQEKAAGAVSVIASFDSYKGALVTGGAIAPLVRALEMGSEVGKEEAAQALRKLTENSDNAWSVAAHAGVTVLLKLCGNADSSGELIGLACNILRNLSSVEEINKFMVEQGAVSIFTKLLKSKEEAIQIHALELLNAMALEDDSLGHMVVGEGVIEPLMKLLDPKSPYSLEAKEVALRATELFFFSSIDLINVLMGCGFLDRVLFFLKNGEISTQESGLKIVYHLCEIYEEAKKVMGDAGFMAELVKLLEAKSFEVRELAAEVLCCMVPIQRNCRSFIQDDHNVNQILRLLDPDEEKSGTNKLLLSILMSLANSSNGRRKILASGYINHLEKLAEADVLDAKKIIKRLSSNRFRSILSGIWSL
ncbi:importin subunit alpha-4-like [Cocos nucifera]|uniref:Importin subunit alpha-4-like n=1 Tax=Cocos nucifera TaxID=13894 RepID=A0A8K0IR35_COCNU|nr:importin subunit alpha-4-like [Cocos nucifera]